MLFSLIILFILNLQSSSLLLYFGLRNKYITNPTSFFCRTRRFCPCWCLIYIRAGSVVGRVQELLTTAHDGCKLHRVLKNDNVKRMKKCKRRGGQGSQWLLPSSKDSTPESLAVVAASFSCRLLMISWSSEPELLYTHRHRQWERENKLVLWKETGLLLNKKSKWLHDMRRKHWGNQYKLYLRQSLEAYLQ